jgi:hypothetical protein
MTMKAKEQGWFKWVTEMLLAEVAADPDLKSGDLPWHISHFASRVGAGLGTWKANERRRLRAGLVAARHTVT